MTTTTNRQAESTTATLVMAMELSKAKWKLALHDGRRSRARVVTIAAWDFEALMVQVAKAKAAMGLPAETPVTSCYEAGQEGFSVHRRLEQLGIRSLVIDAASVEVSRRARRAKTDRLDVEMLTTKLLAHLRGEKAFAVVRIPPSEAEGARHEQRELQDLKVERARHRQRIQAWLLTEGIVEPWSAKLLEKLDKLRTIDGRALEASMIQRIRDEAERLELVSAQIARIAKERAQALKAVEAMTESEALATGDLRAFRVRTLAQMKGIGATGAFRLVFECFGWRRFRNRREVGAAFGLAPSPFASGTLDREQGIAKLGNGALRSLVIELSWLWLRYQPASKLAQWFQQRFGSVGGRQRRVGIVALARRLVIALWKYVEYGVVPEGALTKA
jgi:transposase